MDGAGFNDGQVPESNDEAARKVPLGMEVEVKGVRQVSKEGEEGPTPRVMEELMVDHTGEKRRRG
jgi:hypothetical protein